MKQVTCRPTSFVGDVTVPPSKSFAHRAILCAALADGESALSPVAWNRDIEATLNAARALGAEAAFDAESQTVRIQGICTPAKKAEINCLESGSTVRFLIPVAAALGTQAVFTGEGRLPERPIGCYADCLPPHGTACVSDGGLPFSISGQLQPGEFSIPGNISSQFITGLLLALPLLSGDSRITLTTPLESVGYVDITLSVLRDFGIEVHPDASGWRIPGNQHYQARSYTVEGDWSQAAFFLAMGAMTDNPDGIRIHGLRWDSVQGDRAAADVFTRFGARITRHGDFVLVQPPADRLHGIRVDVSDIPDMVPALAACAAACEGTTMIENAARVRIKESDRLAAMENGLRDLGAAVSSTPDSLTIEGASRLAGGTAQGCNDHRIVMALSACAARADAPVTITDAQSIRKTYPNFFEDYNRLGGDAHVLDLG